TGTATSTGSQPTVVHLSVLTPGVVSPDCRDCPHVGNPVNLFSGNVYFDQTDAEVKGFGVTVGFTRSYNSLNRAPGLYGAFGAGWTHQYERVLSFPVGGSGVILLSRGAGSPAYFQDTAGDARSDPSLPLNT